MSGVRFTVDMPPTLHKEFCAACEKVEFSKAQYMRIALEVLNVIASSEVETVTITRKGETRTLLIPGITR